MLTADKESASLKVSEEDSQTQSMQTQPPPISIYLSTAMNHHNQLSALQSSTQTPTSTSTTPVSSLNFSVNAILSGGGGCSNGRSNSTSSNCSTGSNGSNGSSGFGYGRKIMPHQQNIYDTGQQHNQHLASAAFLRITAAAAAASASSPSGKLNVPSTQ